MSSRAVRQMVRTWLGTMSVPFHDTINLEQNPSDPVWLSVEFDAYGYDKDTYCEKFTERGQITLVWMGQSGVGDDALLQTAEADAAAFYANTDPTGKLVLTGRSASDSYIGSDTPYFEVAIYFDYEFTP